MLNNTPSKRLAGYSPTEAFTGHPPTSPLTAIFRPEAADFTIIPTDSATIKAIVNQLQDSLHDIHHRIVSTKPRNKVQRSGQQEVDFDVGDYVLISRVNDKGKDKTRTIWSGPARVTARINDRLFETTNLVNGTTRQYHADFLKRYADKDLSHSVLRFALLVVIPFCLPFLIHSLNHDVDTSWYHTSSSQTHTHIHIHSQHTQPTLLRRCDKDHQNPKTIVPPFRSIFP